MKTIDIQSYRLKWRVCVLGRSFVIYLLLKESGEWCVWGDMFHWGGSFKQNGQISIFWDFLEDFLILNHNGFFPILRKNWGLFAIPPKKNSKYITLCFCFIAQLCPYFLHVCVRPGFFSTTKREEGGSNGGECIPPRWIYDIYPAILRILGIFSSSFSTPLPYWMVWAFWGKFPYPSHYLGWEFRTGGLLVATICPNPMVPLGVLLGASW